MKPTRGPRLREQANRPSGETLAERIGWDGKLTDITADCPRKRAASVSDQCHARCPDLPKVV
jgi:hypothetical protein